MNIIRSGSQYQVYSTDNIQTFSKFPVGTYEICFNKRQGFYLTAHEDLKTTETKIYGKTLEKIDKVLKSFQLVNRNFGVMLSGIKGSGKSIFAKELSKKCLAIGLPVILVNTYAPGLASFLSSIEQEVMILFDEFEKVFSFENDNGERSDIPQEELLSLFDGTDNGKKLFVITCNSTYNLNKYLLNRPGRFHYHFKLTGVSPEEIKEYALDQLKPEYHNNIGKMANLGYFIDVTYDLLRAIIFELNQGYSLESTLSDLNIERKFSLPIKATLILENGSVYSIDRTTIPFDYMQHCSIRGWKDTCHIDIHFYTDDMEIKGNNIIINKYRIAYNGADSKDKDVSVKSLAVEIVSDEMSLDFDCARSI